MHIEFKENFDVKNLTSFKIGGEIKKTYFPKSIAELEYILDNEDSVEVFGNFSNTLVSTEGYDGTIVITTNLENFSLKGSNGCIVEAGFKGPKLAQQVCILGFTGFEFMIGFPGSLGGNIYMNSSANGQCISDNIVRVKCWSKDRGIFWLDKNEMEFSYRSSICQKEHYIVLEAEFVLDRKMPTEIQAKMEENLTFRKKHQPSLSIPNCGSIFRNPEGESAGRLLDSIGAKNFIVGGVRVWENHANFIVNPEKKGTSENVLELMLKMFSSVKEKYGIELKPEVRYLGNRNNREDEICKILNIK